jgi:hypothetical protein
MAKRQYADVAHRRVAPTGRVLRSFDLCDGHKIPYGPIRAPFLGDFHFRALNTYSRVPWIGSPTVWGFPAWETGCDRRPFGHLMRAQLQRLHPQSFERQLW